MTARLIRLCIAHRGLVLFASAILAVFGLYTLRNTPVDALPDLSDVQVIIRTPYPGQAPRLVEDRITYPLSRAMLSVPRTKAVRGFSAFGDSFVYIIFEDGTDLYWARSRVLENLSRAQADLPAGVTSSLGPDATGVGWILEYALVDRTGGTDLAGLRAIQDWQIRFELSGVPGVSEVASVGGAVKEYQIVPDPVLMSRHGVTLEALEAAVTASNQEAGGSVMEQAGAEYMIRATGYLESLEDFRKILVRSEPGSPPVFLEDVASVNIGPEMRRGIAELGGEGEVAGAVVLMRQGENARRVIRAVREKLGEIRKTLPPGVEIVTVYDRSTLIDGAIRHLAEKLAEEFVVVALTCAVFLLHFRSSLVAVAALPLGLLISFIVMRFQGVSANIMSLGGLAIAIGTMVDASIVMVENLHKKLEKRRRERPGEVPGAAAHWEIVAEASLEVGPAIFVSLLVITMSFIPVFSLEGQEGRLFSPLAFTKTYAMAGAAFLSVTLVPVLMGYLVRGRVPQEDRNPVNRLLIRIYHPLLSLALKRPWLTMAAALAVALGSLYPYSRLGGEFLPRMDEGDLLYMPSTLPGVSSAEAARILQITSRLISSVPEVDTVFGKAGRAETATDPAPLEMIETAIHLKPREEWRPGMTAERIVEELDRTVRLPGLANLWVPPIRNRIDMISTGVKSPLGVKVSAARAEDLDSAAVAVQEAARSVPGVASALAETQGQGRYVEIRLDRERAARYGLTPAAAQLYVSSAVGGMAVGETVEGTARYPVNIRYPQSYRDSLESLRSLPMLTPQGQEITLSDIADVAVSKGPSMLKSEQGRPAAWVYLDVRGRDIAGVASDLRAAIDEGAPLPPGVSADLTGQYESMERANRRLKVMIPVTLLIILVLLYWEFRAWTETLFIMFSLPFALAGGLWFMHLAGYSLSVASGVGFIALAGLAAEFGVIMLIYLREAVRERPAFADPASVTPALVDEAIHAGAVLRVRPKAMTVGTVVISLIPIFWSDGIGSEVMKRISAPLFGGMVTAFTLSMFILPAAWKIKLDLLRRRGLKAARKPAAGEAGKPGGPRA
ncbi:MAG: CusA/CzcA family heavy metal efflux RND transporter [Deltaproteobacteria bacterium]|jgi:Cu(I)/Ag(I) efflux system membrane protein CusA/SilA|nr:CusA/CzcA family heavy metal efflux RND transporter [Deltaproteobacteria bacterium]